MSLLTELSVFRDQSIDMTRRWRSRPMRDAGNPRFACITHANLFALASDPEPEVVAGEIRRVGAARG